MVERMPAISTRWKSPQMMMKLPGGEYAAPEHFTAVVAGPPLPFTAELDLVIQDGRAHCRSLCLHAPDGATLKVGDLKRVALKRWCVDALANVAMKVNTDGSLEFDEPDVTDRAVRLGQGRETERLPLDNPERLQRVADTVNAHEGRTFVKAVASELNITRPHAQRLVDLARSKGLVRR